MTFEKIFSNCRLSLLHGEKRRKIGWDGNYDSMTIFIPSRFPYMPHLQGEKLLRSTIFVGASGGGDFKNSLRRVPTGGSDKSVSHEGR